MTSTFPRPATSFSKACTPFKTHCCCKIDLHIKSKNVPEETVLPRFLPGIFIFVLKFSSYGEDDVKMFNKTCLSIQWFNLKPSCSVASSGFSTRNKLPFFVNPYSSSSSKNDIFSILDWWLIKIS